MNEDDIFSDPENQADLLSPSEEQDCFDAFKEERRKNERRLNESVFVCGDFGFNSYLFSQFV